MTRTVACRLSLDEWEAFRNLCRTNRVNYQAMFHSIILDALIDEGYDGLRRRESKGCEGSGEASSDSGATTS